MGPIWEVDTSGRGSMWAKGVRGGIQCKCCVYMYINGKMRPVEINSERGEGEKENNRGGELKYDIFNTL
jgi:hypothetical protein